MNSEIIAVSSYTPPNRVTNDDLAKKIDTSDEWIVSHTGIKARHIADKTIATSDLAYEAAKSALEKAKLSAKDLDLIIVATTSQDYTGFPSVSVIIQGRLGADYAGAFDLAAACTGFVYGLATAKGYIESGMARNVLVVGADVLSRFTNWEDRNTCVLFGDGAGAVILQASDSIDSGDILYSKLRADGSGCDCLQIPNGGSRNPFDKEKLDDYYPYIVMDGRKVYNFAVRVNGEIIEHILEKNNLSIDDISYIVPHQANIRIIQAAAKRLGIPLEKFYINIDEYANTSAATIPIALNEMNDKSLLKKGDLLITVGFGGGLTYGGNLIKW